MAEDQMVNIIIWGEVLFVTLVGIWVYWDHKRKVNKMNKRLDEIRHEGGKIVEAIVSKGQKQMKLDYFFGYGKYGVEDQDDPDQIS